MGTVFLAVRADEQLDTATALNDIATAQLLSGDLAGAERSYQRSPRDVDCAFW
jgi:hypothetical protein